MAHIHRRARALVALTFALFGGFSPSAMAQADAGAGEQIERRPDEDAEAPDGSNNLPQGGDDSAPCNQNSSAARNYDSGGDASPGNTNGPPSPDWRTDYPVLISTGHKIESETDLVVALPGRDFVLRREYSSQRDAHLPRTSGPGWFFPSMSYLRYVWLGSGFLPGGTTDANNFRIDHVGTVAKEVPYYAIGEVEGRHRWSSTGPSTRWFERSVVHVDWQPVADGPGIEVGANRCMLSLVSPGEWESLYFRDFQTYGPGGATPFDPPSSYPGGVTPKSLTRPEDDAAWLLGLLAEERDPYGNRWVYSYNRYFSERPPGSPANGLRPRVRSITCLSRGEAATSGRVNAVITFTWLGDNSPTPRINEHRLRSVVVSRPMGTTGTLVEVQRVVYYYLEDLNLPVDQASTVGTTGDLVLVATYERVDSAADVQGADPILPTGEVPPVAYPARLRVTHYRYHNGQGECVAPGGTPGCFTCTDPEEANGVVDPRLPPPPPAVVRLGAAHQLKQVFPPDRVEHYAQRVNAAAAPTARVTLVAVGKLLAQASPTDPLFTDDRGTAWYLHHLASKGIVYYCNDPSIQSHSRGRVRRQFLSDAPPFSTGAIPGRLLQYEYYEYPEPPAPSGAGYGVASPQTVSGYAKTTRITETVASESGAYAPYRVRTYDTVVIKSAWRTPHESPQPRSVTRYFTANDALLEAPITLTSRRWVTHYVYEPSPFKQTVARMMTPSAMSSYTPGAASTLPIYVPSAAAGLVYAYEHNSNGRLTEVRVRQGAGASSTGPEGTAPLDEHALVVRHTYGTDTPPLGADPGQRRSHLLVKSERFSHQGVLVAGPTDDDWRETTTFTYGMHPNVADDLKPRAAVAWVQTTAEREHAAELGPGGFVHEFELFDSKGDNTWTIASDGALTQRTFQSAPLGGETGLEANELRNTVTPTAPGEPEPLFFESPTTTAELLAAVSGTGLTLGRNADGGLLFTQWRRDALGRIVETTAPGDIRSYVTREMRELAQQPGIGYFVVIELPQKQGSEFNGAARAVWFDASDRPIRDSEYAFPPGSSGVQTTPTGDGYVPYVSSYDAGLLVEIARLWIDRGPTGLPGRIVRWYDVASDRRYEDRLEHDALGRPLVLIESDGSAKRWTRDVRDRLVRVERGLGDTAAVSLLGSLQMMRETHGYEYDTDAPGSPRGGNGAVTRLTERVSASDARVTTIARDFRDLPMQIRRPIAPHLVLHHDNLRRIVRTDTHTALATSPDATPDPATRTRRVTTSYSQRGLVWRNAIALNPSFTNPSNPDDAGPALESLLWRDAVGRVVASWRPDSPAMKARYDGLGRPTTVYATDRGGDAQPGLASSYSDATGVQGDIVYRQSEFGYSNDDVVTLTTTRVRGHDLTAAGDLGQFALGSEDAQRVISSYVGRFYDSFNRIVRVVDYGTNTTGFRSGGARPFDPISPPTSPPSWTSAGDQRVWEVSFNVRGLVDGVVNPTGRRDRTLYDDLSRVRATIENVQGFTDDRLVWQQALGRWGVSGLSSAPDADRVTSVVYNGADRMTRLVAHRVLGQTDTPQVTEYAWGTGDNFEQGEESSLLASADLLSEIRYPNESTGAPASPSSLDPLIVRFAYNRAGEATHVTDQNGTKRRLVRDALGRVFRDEAYALAQGVDARVGALEFEYDASGRLAHARSKTAGTGGVLNAVRFDYDRGAPASHLNPLWAALDVYQQHDGAVTSASPRVSWRLDVAAPVTTSERPDDHGNRARLAGTVYPVDAVGAPGASPDTARIAYSDPSIWVSGNRIGRGRAIELRDGAGGFEALARYSWIGEDLEAVVDLARAHVLLDRQLVLEGFSPAQGTRAPGVYPSLDRFGRDVLHAWVDDDIGAHPVDPHVPISPPIVATRHEYSKASDRLVERDARPGALGAARDRRFGIDGLQRLKEALRGASGPGGSFTPSTLVDSWSESWTPDATTARRLDALGNWGAYAQDRNGDGDFTDPDELEDRSHNMANEIVERLVRRLPAAPDTPLALTHDDSGNLISSAQLDGSTQLLTYDAWNRLVRVRTQMGTAPATIVAEHEYNALGWRILSRSDTSSPGAPADGVLDQSRLMLYDAAWRLLEERIDDDLDAPTTGVPGQGAADGPDRVAQLFWGSDVSSTGIDDALYRREGALASSAPGGAGGSFLGWTPGREWCALTDIQGSVIALVQPDTGGARATLVERVSYTAYGRGRLSPAGDVDGDGAVSFTDLNLVLGVLSSETGAYIGEPGYSADADLDRSGAIDFSDLNAVLSGFGEPRRPAGEVSAPFAPNLTPPPGWAGGTGRSSGLPAPGAGPDSVVGYAGYVYARDIDLYSVRYRVYSAALGRFVTRDPIGYADGENLYQYVRGQPILWTDPLGLMTDDGMSRPYLPALQPGDVEPQPTSLVGCGSAGTSLDDIQTVLECAGFLPGIGVFIDGANGVIYLFRGEYGAAAISFVAMVPIVGDAAAAARLASKADNVIDAGTYVLRHRDTGEVMRVGRTKSFDRRAAEHARDPKLKDFAFEATHRTRDYNQQRGLEQMLHDRYKPPYDRINPISLRNPSRGDYMSAADQFLRSTKP